MVREAARRLTEFLRETVGDGLRTVVIVQPDDYTIHHLRDDLRSRYNETTYQQVVDSFRLNDPFFSPGIEGSPVGTRHAVVHYHENAFVFQFPFSAEETILASVAPEVGQDLLGFIEECRRFVQTEDA